MFSPVGRSRPFSTKQTSGCRQKEKPQNPSQLRLRPPPADADRLAAINFYLVKAQRVPVAGIDSVREKQITRLWGGVWGGGWAACCPACEAAQEASSVWSCRTLGAGLRLNWILLLPPYSPPSFPPFLFWSKNCLLWLLSTTCVWFDSYFLPVHVQEDDPILPFQVFARLPTRETLLGLGQLWPWWVCQCFFHKITPRANCFSHQQTSSEFWNVLTSLR